ncbi:carbon-nitrogen hydrolase [Xylaria acuta]|nr:carbon-nitrogen hydrolase [Xylaria acuta]
MRVGCLQFAPQVGDIDNNLNRADAVLNKANPEDLDLLVLPELAFTGYNFKSLQQISPFLESQGSGISALWARTIALKLNCVVTVGYPEKVDVKSKWPTSPEYYNSVIVVNSDGETIANYRKTFLYYTDETWALEGPEGFYGGFIPELDTTASMGICMDLNPYKFEAPWHAFEFAFHCLEVEANLVILTMAWLTREDASLFSRMPNEPDMDTLTYWISRLEPLIRSESREEIIIIFCNRTGIESDAVYAGTSAVIGVKDGEVNVYGILGRGEKDLLVVDTEKPPYAKMVYRPDDQASIVTPVLESASGFEGTGQTGFDQTTTTKLPSAQPSPKGNSTGTTGINTAQYQAQGLTSSKAACSSATSKNSSGLAYPKDADGIADYNHREKTSRQEKARSLPMQISPHPATGTARNEISPQSSTGLSQFPSDTRFSTPTEIRTRALARADSPTLNTDMLVTSQAISNRRVESRFSGQAMETRHIPKRTNSVSPGHATHSTRLGEAGIDRPQSRAASRDRQQATCDANDDRNKPLDSVKHPSAPSFDLKSLAKAKAEIGRDSPEWLVGGTEDENEIVEIIMRRSSSCLVHGRSQGIEFKTPGRSSSQRADGYPPVFAAEEPDSRNAGDGAGAFGQSLFDDTQLNLDNSISPVEAFTNLEGSPATPLTAPFIKASKLTIQGMIDGMTIGPQCA